MVLEYLLVLMMTVVILAGSLGLAGNSKGPIQMLNTNAPKLAHRLEKRTITGSGFLKPSSGLSVQWKSQDP